MYFGHYAVAAAMRARKPTLPLVPIVVGVAVLDLLHGLFVLAGLEKVTPDLAALPYLHFDLTDIDWSHSLLMAALWSIAWGALFLGRRQVALVAALAAFSHFVVDWPMHNDDLALYPRSTQHLGLGLWGKLGGWSWGLELVFSIVLLGYAWKKDTARGRRPVWPTAFIGLLALQLSPWLSPLQWVARLPEPTVHRVYAAIVFVGFLLPSAILGWLYSRLETAGGNGHARSGRSG
jgi:hypothetical protein